jgi:hypothetical protein
LFHSAGKRSIWHQREFWQRFQKVTLNSPWPSNSPLLHSARQLRCSGHKTGIRQNSPIKQKTILFPFRTSFQHSICKEPPLHRDQAPSSIGPKHVRLDVPEPCSTGPTMTPIPCYDPIQSVQGEGKEKVPKISVIDPTLLRTPSHRSAPLVVFHSIRACILHKVVYLEIGCMKPASTTLSSSAPPQKIDYIERTMHPEDSIENACVMRKLGGKISCGKHTKRSNHGHEDGPL